MKAKTKSTPARLPMDAYPKMINQAHADVIRGVRRTIDGAMRCGDLLAAAKREVIRRYGHGEWETWLEANCPNISVRTVQVYMSLAEHRPAIEAYIKTQPLKARWGQ
jgi:hypothetical protein